MLGATREPSASQLPIDCIWRVDELKAGKNRWPDDLPTAAKQRRKLGLRLPWRPGGRRVEAFRATKESKVYAQTTESLLIAWKLWVEGGSAPSGSR